MQAIAAPFSNLQLELLKVYSHGISDEELTNIRRMLARYFMERAVNGATRIWENTSISPKIC